MRRAKQFHLAMSTSYASKIAATEITTKRIAKAKSNETTTITTRQFIEMPMKVEVVVELT